MLWMFERGEESRRIETRFDNTTGEYVLIHHLPGPDQEIERFPDADSFGVRLKALEAEFEAGRWEQSGPVMLSDGWKIG